MRLLIAGVTSGCGKTTITCAVIAALRRRGLRVQPYKGGPDYIDPTYHTQAAGVPARNLDSWMLPAQRALELFGRVAASSDIAVVEGMMGLYDGRADTEEGSSAQLAKLLGAPVLLVVDAGQTSRTAAAIALGMQRFDPALRIGGVILNNVSSEAHRAWAAGPIESATGIPVLGTFPRRPELALPERHLGLVPSSEHGAGEELFDGLAAQAEQTFDLDGVLALARSAPPLEVMSTGILPDRRVPARARIALALDEACSFYYEDNLDLLRAWGAEIVPFSPMRDPALPGGVGALYIGGGFPEVYAAQLSGNLTMHGAIRTAAASGMPIYAECGGLMYLSEGIVDFGGARHAMVGLVPGWSAMRHRKMTLGYREVTARTDLPHLRAGDAARGHEFHWSVMEQPVPEAAAAYSVGGDPAALEGYARGNLVASYCHLHFASNPRIAPALVEAASAHRPSEQRPR